MMAVAAVVALRLRRGRRGGERQVGGDEGEEQRAAHVNLQDGPVRGLVRLMRTLTG